MSRFVFALTLVLACAGAASAEYLPWPWGPGLYVMGAQTSYPSMACGPRDFVWHDSTPVVPVTVIRRAAPLRPTQIRVEAPAEAEIAYGDAVAKASNGVITINLAGVNQPTTVNLVVRDKSKKERHIPVAMIPGSQPKVMIWN